MTTTETQQAIDTARTRLDGLRAELARVMRQVREAEADHRLAHHAHIEALHRERLREITPVTAADQAMLAAKGMPR